MSNVVRTAPLIEPRYQLPIFEVTPLIVTASPMQAKLEAGPRPTFDNDSIEFVNQFCYNGLSCLPRHKQFKNLIMHKVWLSFIFNKIFM